MFISIPLFTFSPLDKRIKAAYVVHGWAGAVIERVIMSFGQGSEAKKLQKCLNSYPEMEAQTDGQMGRPTDQLGIKLC